MLFLLNDRIVEVETPDIHLEMHWRSLGCGDPRNLTADDAVDFVQRVLRQCRRDYVDLTDDVLKDLSALIVTKTGANAALIPLTGPANTPARLTCLPKEILAKLKGDAERTGEIIVSDVWETAA